MATRMSPEPADWPPSPEGFRGLVRREGGKVCATWTQRGAAAIKHFLFFIPHGGEDRGGALAT